MAENKAVNKIAVTDPQLIDGLEVLLGVLDSNVGYFSTKATIKKTTDTVVNGATISTRYDIYPDGDHAKDTNDIPGPAIRRSTRIYGGSSSVFAGQFTDPIMKMWEMVEGHASSSQDRAILVDRLEGYARSLRRVRS